MSDPVNKWVFAQAKGDIYIVGGYLRDLIIGNNPKDLDFVSNGDVEALAKSAANKFKGTFINLKNKLTYRIALKDKRFIDFTYLNNSIEEDLFKRDFTTNALAWSPISGIVDKTGGIRDLDTRIIRTISPENLADDPLRVLRAYRLSALLEFKIDRSTRQYLKKYAPNLKNIPYERITNEFIKLLNAKLSYDYIMLSYDDNVLHHVIDLTDENIKLNLTMLKTFDIFMRKIISNYANKSYNYRLSDILNRNISQDLSCYGLIRLAIIMYRSDANLLNLSNINNKKLRAIQSAINIAAGRLTGSRLFELLNGAENSEYEAVIAAAVISKRDVSKYLDKTDSYLRIIRKPLLKGDEIGRIISKQTDPLLGQIKNEINRRQFLGILKNKTDAKHWIKSNLT